MWKLIKKYAKQITFTGIAAAIGIGYTIIDRHNSPSTELRATVEYGSYLLDPDTMSLLEGLESDKFRHELIDELRSDKNKSRTLVPFLLEIEKKASFILDKNAGNITYNSLSGIIKTVITNTGDIGVEHASLRMPNVEMSLVAFEDKTIQIFRDTKTIDLGEIKPNQTLTVYSWSNKGALSLRNQDDPISLSHAKGKGTVIINGQQSQIVAFLTSPYGLFFIILCIWLFLRFLYERGIEQGRKEISAETVEKPNGG